LAQDERLARGVDDFGGDGVEAVDLHDALDLGEEADEQAEVAVGGPRDRGDRFGSVKSSADRLRSRPR
jgi:hypothetical protein